MWALVGTFGLWWSNLDPLSCDRLEIAKSMFVIYIAYHAFAEMTACGS